MDFSTFAAVGAAAITLLGVLYGHILVRIKHVEDDLEDEQDYNRSLWLYCRSLIDDYYRHRRPDAPDPKPLPERRRQK